MGGVRNTEKSIQMCPCIQECTRKQSCPMSFTVCWDNSGYYINLMTKLKKKRQAGYGINNAKIIHPNIRKIQHQNKSRTEPLEV